MAALVGTSVGASAQSSTIKACLVQTIDTSRWSPPSPDPAGIISLPNGHLLVSDSEVEECVNSNPPAYWHGVNLFEADRSGTLLATATTYTPPPGSCTPFFGPGPNFTSEPTGMARNPTNGHLFFSDDDLLKVFEVDLGPDSVYGTADDRVTSFSTAALNSPPEVFNPEGVAFGLGDLFVVSAGKPGGEGTTDVYQLDPGPNGRFDGLPAVGGDDVVVNHFRTDTFNPGVTDPEGIAFNPDHNSLYIIGRDRHLIETTPTGTLVNQIDITPVDTCAPADVAYAPSSLNAGVKHLYIPDRGVDNGEDRLENDGKVYELALDPIECAQLPQNLLLNPGFENDCDTNTLPDQWSENSHFTRSNTVVHSGNYAGKHFATDEASYTINQTVTGLSAGMTYNFSGWVNIPPTTDAFTFGLEVQWRDASNNTLSTQTLKTYTAATNGWDPVVVNLLAPTGTTSAQVRMVVSSLNATIYVDDFVFKPEIPFNFSLTNGGSKSVAQGTSVSTTLSTTLVAGTAQSVSFSAAGLPTGATASFVPTACTPTCSTTLTLSTVPSTPTGTYTITVTGTGGGVTKTTSFSLTVTPAVTPFTFSLTNGGSKSVTQGAAVSNTISATLVSGTTQSASFSAAGLPTNATASFLPATCSLTCSTTLTISTTASTPTGTYTITVTGIGGGITKTTSFSLTVTAPGSPASISFQDSVFPTSLYSGTRDTYLARSAPSTNFGAATTLWVDSAGGSPALLRWKGITIPAGSTVQSATLTLNVTTSTSGTYNLYALKRDWWEDQSNWNSYGPGFNWEIPGAKGTLDRGTTVVGTITVPTLGQRTITLNAAGIALVQSWVDSPSTNNGLIIDNSTTVADTMAFDARNALTASNRPKLTVIYVTH